MLCPTPPAAPTHLLEPPYARPRGSLAAPRSALEIPLVRLQPQEERTDVRVGRRDHQPVRVRLVAEGVPECADHLAPVGGERVEPCHEKPPPFSLHQRHQPAANRYAIHRKIGGLAPTRRGGELPHALLRP